MTPDDLKSALESAGWRIGKQSLRSDDDDVPWYAWLPSTVADRANMTHCVSNEKPPAFCIEPHEFKHQSGTHRSVEFRVCGAVGEKEHWLDLRLYSVPMDECLDTIPDAIKLLVAAWNAAAMAGRAIRKGE